ncbi:MULTISPECIES: MaoC family dehydratase [Deefgea]|uniref:(R)-hydratase n=1 Tax=Deefgea chitinilytica TaxID=570276 RepID=A0ABS2C9P8_9NEIS|nr:MULTISPECIES: MaoC family dehydratase [Deefgea]MBM5570218.1 (R)-hydratase [Deefgea chitinilytica]MBM9887447.1 MaoC family dehydratase [Deefgea sp. CFH1-16]
MARYFNELSVGDFEEYRKTVTETDVVLFAGLTGDNNPMHIDEEFASQTRFGSRIIHGMLTASFLSSVIGMKMPGPGCIYMGQNIKFLKPVHIGETVTARATIIEIYPEKQRVKLLTECIVRGVVVLTGDALVWVPNKES